MKNVAGGNGKPNSKVGKNNSVNQTINRNGASLIGNASNFKGINNTIDQLSNDPLSI